MLSFLSLTLKLFWYHILLHKQFFTVQIWIYAAGQNKQTKFSGQNKIKSRRNCEQNIGTVGFTVNFCTDEVFCHQPPLTYPRYPMAIIQPPNIPGPQARSQIPQAWPNMTCEVQRHNWDLTQQNLSSGFAPKRDSNQSHQLQRLGRKLRFHL